LTLAILTGVALFALFPLLKWYMAWRLNEGVVEDGALIGATLPYDFFTWATALLGLAVLLTALFAWVGRPKAVRWLYQGFVLLTCLLLLAESYVRLTEEPRTAEEALVISSGQQTIATFLRCQIPFQILVVLYIIWYCNRAPARAFYSQVPLAPLKDEES
jgi:hypothetical protein